MSRVMDFLKHWFSKDGNVGRRFIITLVLAWSLILIPSLAQDWLSSDDCDAACEEQTRQMLQRILGTEEFNPEFIPEDVLEEVFDETNRRNMPSDVLSDAR